MRATSRRARALRIALGAVAVLGVAAGGLIHLHTRQREAALVRADPERIASDPSALRLAESLARPVYARHCAGCHGADLHGQRRIGAPDLADQVWLYSFGQVLEIETTLLYGVRSGHPKSHNITDMPGLGRSGQLTAAEVRDVVEYVYSLSHQDADASAARRGAALFADKGVCYDCHGADATGNVDYGAPDLTGHTWLYGGDRATLTASVRDGRHGLCPAWIGRLSALQIRALALYLHARSHPAAVAR